LIYLCFHGFQAPSVKLIDHNNQYRNMNTFSAYMLRKAYENVRKNGDKLAESVT